MTAALAAGLIATAAVGSASTTGTDDLLSQLETEEVAPGVLKVIGDGTGHDLDSIRSFAITPDGTVWAAPQKRRIFRLGEPGVLRAADGVPGLVYDLEVAADGTLLVSYIAGKKRPSRRISSFDGQAWTKGELEEAVIAADGSAWDLLIAGDPDLIAGDPARFDVARLDTDGSTIFTLEDMGFGSQELWVQECREASRVSGGDTRYCFTDAHALAATPDGAIWVGVQRCTPMDCFPSGVARFDGETWEEVRPFDSEDRYSVLSLDVGPDGALWANLLPLPDLLPDGAFREPDFARGRLARWDGEAWTSFDWPAGIAGFLGDPMVFGPDGTIWFGLTAFDGTNWTRYETPASPGAQDPLIDSLDVAPDGSVWVLSRDDGTSRSRYGLYIIRPESAVPLSTDSVTIARP